MRVPTVAAGDPVVDPLATRPDQSCAASVPLPRWRSLVDVFTETASAHPYAVALEVGGDRLTYADLRRAATQVATQLRAEGVGPGERVGVRVTGGTADLYVAILGVLFAGASYVPVDADDPQARATDAFRSADVAYVITDGLVLTPKRPPRDLGVRELSVDDDAWIIFTSGSTGTPKAVAVTHRAAVAFVDAEAELFDVGPHDRVAAGLSVAFDASCEEMWLAWRHGAALVVAPRSVVRSGIDFGPWLRARRISIVSTVPTLAALWDDDVASTVRTVILGGEPCSESLVWRLAARCVVWNTYGPTEATVVSTAARLSVGEPVHIGHPLRGWEVAVVDDAGRPVAAGAEGELVIAGVGLGRYLDVALDAQRFAPVPALRCARAYRTGDIVRETPGGLVFVGRRDRQVKLAGRRVDLGEVDAHLLRLPGVRTAASALRTTPNGGRVLVGYVCGDLDTATARARLAAVLPEALVPVLVAVDRLPTTRAGKVDRDALPWPPTTAPPPTSTLTATAAWLAERWTAELGPWPVSAESNFFELGGTSVAVARLVSALRARFPSVAVADVYANPTLQDLARRLDELAPTAPPRAETAPPHRRGWAGAQVLGVAVVLALRVPAVVIALLAYNNLTGGAWGPSAPWLWLALAALVFVSPPGRAGLVVALRRSLLWDLSPGRYPRYGSLALRVWFVEQVANAYRLHNVAGTPWAATYARLSGATVGDGVHLGTLPPPTAIVVIGSGATVESGVDLHGWWFDGPELVVGTVEIGERARVGARSVLMPGARLGVDAEVDAGSVVESVVPAGERWAGSPARPVGDGPQRRWPADERSAVPTAGWRLMYAAGLAAQAALPLVVALPALAIVAASAGPHAGLGSWTLATVRLAPVLATAYVLAEVLVVAAAFRAASSLLKPGWHSLDGGVAWGAWFSQALLESAMGTLFPIYASVYTRSFLRLLGVRVGRRTEMSHAVTINRLVSVGALSFAADDVGFMTTRIGRGWIRIAPITVGSGTFLGNGAVVDGATSLGDDALIGVLSTAPPVVPDRSSWFGAPALELPRVADPADPARTTCPARRVVLARAAVEVIRVIGPRSVSMALIAGVVWTLEWLGARSGIGPMVALAPAVFMVAALVAALTTVTAKWLVIGRYRPGAHPLWSPFVWRDEIMNSTQEELAGAWLLNSALGTPIVSWYLRAMGATVGRNVHVETLNITEFDVVTLHDGAVINRAGHVETHLFHDRVLQIGPTELGFGATVGPHSAVLPDTVLEAGSTLGARSVVLRGERLPAGTRWHGAPVVAW